MRRVVVTGLGAITPLGVGVRRTWSRILNGECGVTSVRDRSEHFAALPCHVAAVVPEGPKEDGKWTSLEWVSKDEAHKTAKFAQYGLAAAEEALQDAGWKPSKPDDLEATGVCLGSGIGNLEDLYDTSVAYNTGGYRKIHPLFVPRLLINLGAGHISLRYGFKVATNFPSIECVTDNVQGPNHAVTTACTTGAHSIGDAYRFITFGDADVMVAGGSESCLHPLAIGGFARSRSLTTDFNDTPQLASRPFDKDRSGFVMGEGAGVLVLEELEHAKARGAKIYAEVAGYGCTADAHHLTAPLADGGGAYRAMKQALKNAKIAPASVDYINAHATSTPLGDAAENRAVKRLMLGPEGKEKAIEINVSSTKGAIAHLLGAAGSIEALFTVLAIHEGILPPTINLDSKTSDFDCNYVPNTAQEQKVDIALTNSFGFGGTNATWPILEPAVMNKCRQLKETGPDPAVNDEVRGIVNSHASGRYLLILRYLQPESSGGLPPPAHDKSAYKNDGFSPPVPTTHESSNGGKENVHHHDQRFSHQGICIFETCVTLRHRESCWVKLFSVDCVVLRGRFLPFKDLYPA